MGSTKWPITALRDVGDVEVSEWINASVKAREIKALEPECNFVPHSGWRDAIERAS